MTKEKRQKMLSIIHIQKKQLGLSEDEYRNMLFGITGEDSASKMNYYHLSNVINSMNRLMDQKGLRTNAYGIIYQQNKFLLAVEARAKNILGTTSDVRLAGFLSKINKSNLVECNNTELRRVMGFLSAIERSQKKV